MTRATITLRAMATIDAVRMFQARGVPMVLQPIADGAGIPAGWQLVLMATPAPKHKSAATNRRNHERRRR